MPDLNNLRDFWRSLEPRSQLGTGRLGAGSGRRHVRHLPLRLAAELLDHPDRDRPVLVEPHHAGAVVGRHPLQDRERRHRDRGPQRRGVAGAGRAGLGRLANGGHVDFSLFDHSSLSATDFQQQVNYQRALEGQIANTIEGISGVDSAQVQLVLPKEQLFQDQSSQATAIGQLSAPMGLDPSSVQGVAHMVASSVQGLDPQNVTITDQTGAMLWPTGDGTGGGGAPSKLAAQEAYAGQLSAQIDALLTRTLGPGKAEARVNVDLNVDKTSTDSVTYDHAHPPVVLNSNKTDETLKSNGSSAGGVSGTPCNTGITTYPGGTTAGGNSQYQNKSEQLQNGVDKTVSHTDVAPGAVNRMDVALLVDKSVSGADLTSVQNAVSSMVGIDPSRGDTLTVSSLAFAKQPSASSGGGGLPVVGNPTAMAKPAGASLLALIFLFLVRRNLKRREGDPTVPEPRWLSEITQATPIAHLGSGGAAPLAESAGAGRRKAMQATAEEIVKQQPDQVAHAGRTVDERMSDRPPKRSPVVRRRPSSVSRSAATAPPRSSSISRTT